MVFPDKFPDMWKLSNITPICENEDKLLAKDERQISLLPICGKILEYSYSMYFIPHPWIQGHFISYDGPGNCCEKIVLCILHPTKHHIHESEMSSDMSDIYVITQFSLVCYVYML